MCCVCRFSILSTFVSRFVMYTFGNLGGTRCNLTTWLVHLIIACLKILHFNFALSFHRLLALLLRLFSLSSTTNLYMIYFENFIICRKHFWFVFIWQPWWHKVQSNNLTGTFNYCPLEDSSLQFCSFISLSVSSSSSSFFAVFCKKTIYDIFWKFHHLQKTFLVCIHLATLVVQGTVKQLD